MEFNLIKSSFAILKLLAKPNLWKYDSRGYCPSCNHKSIFLFSVVLKDHLLHIVSGWKSTDRYKARLLERENCLCSFCNANYRMRAHAASVLKLLGMASSAELITVLKNDSHFHVYETAAYNIFRANAFKKLLNYEVSEYFEDAAFGSYVNGIRNENLERLTFPDNTFDIVINSDVLEHVCDLGRALSEIRRVLKPGGFHVFTVPVDHELPQSVERAKIVDGRLNHLMEPIMHGDPMRREGILAFRDFGNDVLDYTSIDGFECKELKYFKEDKFITSVYYAQKLC